MKLYIKTLPILLLFGLLGACATIPEKPSFKAEKGSKYHINSVTLILKQKYDNKNYPNQDELQEIFEETIVDYLCNYLKRCAQANDSKTINIDFKLEYERLYTWQTIGFRSWYEGHRITDTVTIFKEFNGVMESSDLSSGIKGGRLSRFLLFTFKRGKEDEIKDIKDIARVLVNNVIKAEVTK